MKSKKRYVPCCLKNGKCYDDKHYFFADLTTAKNFVKSSDYSINYTVIYVEEFRIVFSENEFPEGSWIMIAEYDLWTSGRWELVQYQPPFKKSPRDRLTGYKHLKFIDPDRRVKKQLTLFETDYEIFEKITSKLRTRRDKLNDKVLINEAEAFRWIIRTLNESLGEIEELKKK